MSAAHAIAERLLEGHASFRWAPWLWGGLRTATCAPLQPSGTGSARHSPVDHKMQNDEGHRVDLYIPRKCSATNRLIAAKEHGSIQLNVGQVDGEGKYTSEFYTFHMSGAVRQKGESDACLNRLLHEAGLLTFSN